MVPPAAKDAPNYACIEHCWRYFELHSGQRISVFNYFVAFAGLASAGLAAVIQNGQKFAVLGVMMGLMISVVTIVFWKLDQRMSMLVKHAEKALVVAENADLGPHGRLFATEDSEFSTARQQAKLLLRPQTMGASFRILFIVMGIVGLGGSVVSAMLAMGTVAWEANSEKRDGMVVQILQHSKADATPTPTVSALAQRTKDAGTTALLSNEAKEKTHLDASTEK